MMPSAELQSQRILLRSLRPDDSDDVFEYASDPVVTRYAGWVPHRSPYDSMAYIQRCCDDRWGPMTFAVEHLDDGKVIGVVDIRIVSRIWKGGEIGYTLSRQYWGQGLNVEAGGLLIDFGFESLSLHRIQAVCHISNHRSVRTMEKLDMVRERILYGVREHTGEIVDRVVYSILRREWSRRRQGQR
jgi:ribosomal-protein-alanine N-acetyltransferase